MKFKTNVMRYPSFMILSLFCGLTVAVFAGDPSRTVALPEAPVAVQKTIRAQAGDGRLGDIDMSTNGGDCIYDVALTAKDGATRDFTVAADGTLLSAEVPLAETPARVQIAIKTLLGDGRLTSVEKELADPPITYDVEWVAGAGREMYATLAADGTLLSQEVALGETPAPVQKTIAAQLAGGTLDSVDKNFAAPGVTYDVEALGKDGREMSFTVAADGRLSSEEVALSATTPAAQKTILARVGDGKIICIDKTFTGDLGGFKYEVQSRIQGRSFDFSVGRHGRFLGLDQ